MRLLLILGFLMTLLNVNAQKFVSTDNVWITNEGYYNPLGGAWIGNDYMYKFVDSTEFNGLTYLNLHRAEAPDFDTFEPYNYYREENGEVYLYYTTGDRLLYDFNWMIGDTAFAEIDVIVTDVDSVELEDGSMRKRIILEGTTGYQLKIVEGVGGENYVFYPSLFQATDGASKTNCFLSKNVLLYSREPGGCSDFVSNNDEIKLNEYSLVKSDKDFQIFGEYDKELSMKFYTSTGLALQYRKVNSNHYRLLDNIPSGLVICQLFKGRELAHVELFYIQ